jgi:N-methylhydantoinase B
MNPITLEILKNAFTAIPEEMGAALKRTAYSPNIKERMDASCAIFDAEGRMLAQAEHIPVHLGALPLTVEFALKHFEELQEGDQIVVNDPYHGGSHLSDIAYKADILLSREAVHQFKIERKKSKIKF